MSDITRISASHLSRAASVYLRQASPILPRVGVRKKGRQTRRSSTTTRGDGVATKPYPTRPMRQP
jgi:hypothetical protein